MVLEKGLQSVSVVQEDNAFGPGNGSKGGGAGPAKV